MVSVMPVLLPYGLSENHRRIRRQGKAAARPFGGSARWHTPSLQQLSSIPIILPILNNRNSETPPRNRNMSSRLQVRKIRNATMGVADSHNRKAKISVTTAKVRRDRTPKLKPQSRAAANTKKQSDKANRRKPVEPSTRFGNCKEAPITLDDDEDEMDGGFPGRTLPQVRRDLRRDMTTPPPAPSSSSIYSPQFGKTTPSRSHTPYGSSFGHRETFLAPPVTARLERRERDQSFYASARCVNPCRLFLGIRLNIAALVQPARAQDREQLAAFELRGYCRPPKRLRRATTRYAKKKKS
jgi:hypothetical protein